jgi:hypothetical protein
LQHRQPRHRPSPPSDRPAGTFRYYYVAPLSAFAARLRINKYISKNKQYIHNIYIINSNYN